MSGFFQVLLYLVLTFFAATGGTTPISPADRGENDGFLYGQLTLKTGEAYEGFLRWEDEEAFWDDLFHSRQSELSWLEHADLAELHQERKRRYFENHGMFDRIMWTLQNREGEFTMSRLFICQFGYLDGIEIDAKENVLILIRGGDRVPVNGYSNDVSSDLIVYPDQGDPLEVDWDDLASVTFAPAPSAAIPYAKRLYGTVTSTEGTFEGFIQWDQSECTSNDILDGSDREIPMGDIRSLTKNRRGNSDLILKDGTAFTMTGTNDVDGGNRGIMVENPSWGRVTIGWKRFQSITFAEGHGSGASRKDFAEISPLQATITGTGGETWNGRIVYDLDEAWSRDIFNGAIRDLEYDIPFHLIDVIEKRDESTCRVRLISGRVLDLSESQDTGDRHAGVLVFADPEQEAIYLPWSRIAAIKFRP
jgi:hypothetical protein